MIRRGLTLLELLLSLSLSAVVLMAVGAAVDFHLRVLDTRRADVEEAQLARAVLNVIARDLRSLVYQSGTDFSAAADMAGDALGTSGTDDGSSGSGSGDPLGDAMSDLMGGSSSIASSDISTATEPPPVPGLYGNEFQLLIDVSRLPRVDEYMTIVDPEDPNRLLDVPSDVKSVAYYVQQGTIADDGDLSLSNSARVGLEMRAGLVRRSLDRSVTLWAIETGNTIGLESAAEVIAPEVTGIQFRYFDGLEWLLEWDTEEIGYPPLAVEILVSIRRLQTTTRTNTLTAMQNDARPDLVYRRVVRIPGAAVPSTEEDDAMQAMGITQP